MLPPIHHHTARSFQRRSIRSIAALLLGALLLGVLAACNRVGGSAADSADADNTQADSESGTPADRHGQQLASTALPRDPNDALDVSGGPIRIIEVPTVANQADIVLTPMGFFALSVDSGGRTFEGARSALYHSQDGMRWDNVPLRAGNVQQDPIAAADGTLQLTDLAYGAGHFVMTDGRAALTWHSTDGKHWETHPQDVDSVNAFRSVDYLGDRFIAYGFRNLGVSLDGIQWQRTTVPLVQLFGAAFGDGHYVLTGSGPVLTSSDGEHWTPHDLNCIPPEVCVTDPDGGMHQVLTEPLYYAQDGFHHGRLTSVDGNNWTPGEQEPADGYVDGYFMRLRDGRLEAFALEHGPDQLVSTAVIRHSAWAQSAAGRSETQIGKITLEELPASIDASFEDGLTCMEASCFVLNGRLLMLPPPGTPPLPDRVLRTAEGAPLLSDECPNLRQVFCEDYAARSGCHCEKQAPSSPEQCQDVSQFTCQGDFAARDGEWPLPDLAEGGCSCDAVDGNQPPTFGLRCAAGDNTCAAPLQCLAVQPPFSIGPPEPEPTVCTAPCATDGDCPRWTATGFCAAEIRLTCQNGSCQPRECPRD